MTVPADRVGRQSSSLAGTWDLVDPASGRRRRVRVPACWEDSGVAKDAPGPFIYRRQLLLPALGRHDRAWLRFGAVSYACRVLVDGEVVGSHVGAWDTFEVEITDAVRGRRAVALEIEVEKPASLTAGPDSAAIPGRYPLRETLAGFLPYVWGHLFGGIWQDVRLDVTGGTVIRDAHVRGTPDGRVRVEAKLSAPAVLHVNVDDALGRRVAHVDGPRARQHRVDMRLPHPRAWSPASPALYTAHLWVDGRDERTVRFGLRQVGVEGSRITLNGDPIYPRLVLSWGWYPERLTPDPDPERVRRDMQQLRDLGFNGVKLCLWFPPESYLEAADELGMLVWVELPMWLPRPSAAFLAQVGPEYERIVRVARNHPSVILYTLGCELNRDTADLLGPLYERVKGLVGDALVRDNSGSGEAYGGRLDEFADFHDHHFYADLPYLRGLLDHFAPRWRAEQPWLFGEFADSDAFRDPRSVADERRLPWWVSRDRRRNPQGARWSMEVTSLPSQLDRTGDAVRADELRRISEQASSLHRRYTLELVRSVREVSGYVVTGERDTPINTAGLWDDTGRLRQSAREIRGSNGDVTVLVGWDRRRSWVAGGDRPAAVDPWTHRSGDQVRAHLVLSHFGRARGAVDVEWWATRPGPGGEIRFVSHQLRTSRQFAPGDLREVAIAQFEAPDVAAPTALTLGATMHIGAEHASNEWPMWVFPIHIWQRLGRVGVFDPDHTLDDLAPMVGERLVAGGESEVAIATGWARQVDRFVRGGGRLVLLQPDRHGPLPATPLPFWREAIRVAEPHPAWGDFPTQPFIGLQLFAASADHALDTAGRKGRRPILRRLDARTGMVHDYAVELEWGRGRLIATTLRLAGGSGELPLGISRSPGALHLLGCWLRYLEG